MTFRPKPYHRRPGLYVVGSRGAGASEPPMVIDGEVVEPEPEPPAREAPPAQVRVPQPRPQRGPRAPSAGPGVAILTLREIRPIDDFGGLIEAEDALVDALAAGLYRVVLTSPKFAKGPLTSPMLRRAMGASRLAPPYRIEHYQRQGEPADVLLILARDLRDLAALVGVPGWHELGTVVMVHIATVSEWELRGHPELVGQLRRRVDALFAGSEMPPLGHLRSDRLRTVEVVPPLLDVLAFPAKLDPLQRTIDVFSPGPDRPGQDALLRRWAERNEGSYQRGVGQLGAVNSLDQHRRIFTAMATRSRVFLTNYQRFGHRRHAGEHREVGTRFYEAMAAGCALVGDLPAGSRVYGEYVAAAGALSFPTNSGALPVEVAAALADPAVSAELGAVARAAALRRNDVAHRWQEMITHAGVPASGGIDARVARLAGIADGAMADGETGSGDAVSGGPASGAEGAGGAGAAASGAGGDRDEALDRP